MKNKNIIFGLIGLGALGIFYFWNKNKKIVKSQTITEKPKTDLISEGANKIVNYAQQKYQGGKNPKYSHRDIVEYFSGLTDYGRAYLSLEQTIKKYAKNEIDQKNIIDIYLWDISRQIDANDVKLSNEGSLFLAKNPTIIDDIRGKKSKIAILQENLGNKI
jgi:hypothetical protein